jgi:N-acetylmuramoyl-L-alanine amidase
MLIFLDRQHTGQIDRLDHTGASRDLDGDGKISFAEMEAFFTPFYLFAAELKLRSLGYDVLPISDGKYAERHQRANKYQDKYGSECIYIAAHLNAGSGGGIGYGSMFYDERSGRGRELALSICNKMEAQLPELKNDCRAIAASRDNWTKNAFYTIKGVKAFAICAEPAFIDSPAHRALFDKKGMERIGEALADGIHEFIKGF